MSFQDKIATGFPSPLFEGFPLSFVTLQGLLGLSATHELAVEDV